MENLQEALAGSVQLADSLVLRGGSLCTEGFVVARRGLVREEISLAAVLTCARKVRWLVLQP